MYDDLVKKIRHCATDPMHCLSFGEVKDGRCFKRLMTQAADAIEELWKKYLASEVDATNLTGWLAEERAKRLWISVTERLPKYGERVLVFGGFTMYVAYYDRNRYGGESWHKLNSKSHYCNPTHWMPLPDPPKEEEK